MSLRALTSGTAMTRGEIAEAIIQGLSLPENVRAYALVLVQLMPDREVKRLGQAADAIFSKAIDCIERKDDAGLQAALEQGNIPAPFIELVMTRVRNSRHHGQ